MKKTYVYLLTLMALLLSILRANSQDVCSPIGWATQNGGTTGGGSIAPITVTTLIDLQTQAKASGAKVIYVSGTMGADVSTRVAVAANKTIIGLPGAKLIGGFDVKASNVIIRNMKVQGPGSVDVNGVDCITIDGSSTTNVWIDHCDIYDGQDGNLDITNGANYIAITWCKFSYTSASSNHQFCNLLGNSDSKTSDRTKLKITMMYNWWTDGCVERMPRVRYGQVHVVNNLFDSKNASYCVRAGIEADILVEANYFDAVKTPIDLYQNNFTAVTQKNNFFSGTSGNTNGSGTAFTPPYALAITAAANVKALVSNATCGAGATMANPTSCTCGNIPVNYTLTTNSAPSNGGTISGAGSYTAGTTASITATPAAGYTFVNWSGDASGTNATTTVAMSSNKNAIANFQIIPPITYTLTTNANPVAGGTISGAGSYTTGTTASITATPAAGYTFVNWSGDASGTNATTTVAMSSNKNAIANFQINTTGSTTIKIEDNATPTTGLCSYDGVLSSNSGASNGKVINLTNSAGKGILWKVNAGTTGSYLLNWRYANGSSSNTFVMKLIVNGVTINATLPFTKTSGSSIFANTSILVTLQSGANDIRLESTAANATADIDWLEITGINAAAGNCIAARSYTAAVINKQQKLIVYPNPSNNKITISFYLPTADIVSITLMHADGNMYDIISNKLFASGLHQQQYEVYGKKPGVYTVIINSKTAGRQTVKLIIQ
jgi:uncharacterized repeat protein (TIGR02543 family)